MADFAPDYTARFRVRYHAAGRDHSQTWRFDWDGTDLTVLDAIALEVQDFYVQEQAFMFDDWTFLGSSYAARGTSIFLPGPAVGETTGSIAFDPAHRGTTAQAFSYVGRSIGGLRAIFFQYGTSIVPGAAAESGDDFRVFSSENADVASSIAQLGLSTLLVANDGLPIVWYPYVNVKHNDYWMRKVRQGA